MQRWALPSRSRNFALFAAGACFPIAIALAAAPPVYDAALFEYIGRALAGGAVLYRDVWDNKLPSIFYVNALWSLIAGDSVVERALLEAGVDLLSGALFARLLVCERVRDWGVPAAAFVVLLALAGYADTTEHYALPLIVLTVLASRSGRHTVAGVCAVVAATFWIPALLTLAVTFSGDRAGGLKTVRAAACTAVLAATFFVLAFGPAVVRELVLSWTAYVGGTETLAERFADAGTVAVPLLAIAALALAGVISAWRARAQPAGRRALIWIAVAVAGAIVPLHPFVHYALGVIPAALYGIVAGDLRLTGRRTATALAVAGGLALAYAVHGHRPNAGSEAARVARVAAVLRDGLGANDRIALDLYEPGIFLASGAPLIDRFELAYRANEKFVAAARSMSVRAVNAGYAARADAIVLMAHDRPLRTTDAVEVCARATAPWHVFVPPQRAAQFARCGYRTRIAQPAGGSVAGTGPAAKAMSPVSP